MSYQKNDVLTVKIEDMGHDGEGIGKCEGYTLFVKDTVIGDLAEVKVIKAKKNYGYARLMRLIEPSAHRVEPVCPVARPCGGCQLQMLDYAEQLRFKEKKIAGNLQRIGGMQRTMTAAANQQHRPAGIAFQQALHPQRKIRVNFPIRCFLPGHMLRPNRMPHIHMFDFGAAIDKHGIRRVLQESVGGQGIKMLHGRMGKFE